MGKSVYKDINERLLCECIRFITFVDKCNFHNYYFKKYVSMNEYNSLIYILYKLDNIIMLRNFSQKYNEEYPNEFFSNINDEMILYGEVRLDIKMKSIIQKLHIEEVNIDI